MQTLAGVEQASVATSIIPMVGQMIMGFILPFALAFVAIPLESFISSSRTVLGVVAAALLRVVAFILRLLGSIAYYLGRCVVNVYDLVIFPTIWLEGVILGTKSRSKVAVDEPLQETNVITGEAIDNLDETIEIREPHQ
jgi:hypothetical protein